MSKVKPLEFECGENKNDGDICRIVALETQYCNTEIFPYSYLVDGNIEYEWEFGTVDAIDGEITGYYCQTCNAQFTRDQLIEMLQEEEE